MSASAGFLNTGALWPMSGADRAAALQANEWRAYADRAELRIGTRVLVTGEHRRIRIMTGDRLTIELSDGQRCSNLVLSRAGDVLRLAGQDGAACDLRLGAAKGFDAMQLSAGFSREVWTIE